MNGEIHSTPTTSAVFTTPVRIIAFAVDRPCRKLVQAVLTSIAAAVPAPSFTESPDAEFGMCSSLEQLPYTMRSRSVAAMPAQASARAAATCAIAMPDTCEMRRSRMPVRCAIHSSLVSRNVARSALVSTDGGMHLPQPVMAAYVIVRPPVLCVAPRRSGRARGAGDEVVEPRV